MRASASALLLPLACLAGSSTSLSSGCARAPLSTVASERQLARPGGCLLFDPATFRSGRIVSEAGCLEIELREDARASLLCYLAEAVPPQRLLGTWRKVPGGVAIEVPYSASAEYLCHHDCGEQVEGDLDVQRECLTSCAKAGRPEARCAEECALERLTAACEEERCRAQPLARHGKLSAEFPVTFRLLPAPSGAPWLEIAGQDPSPVPGKEPWRFPRETGPLPAGCLEGLP